MYVCTCARGGQRTAVGVVSLLPTSWFPRIALGHQAVWHGPTSPGELSHCLCFSKNFLQMTPRNTVSLHYSETNDSDSGLIWILLSETYLLAVWSTPGRLCGRNRFSGTHCCVLEHVCLHGVGAQRPSFEGLIELMAAER